MTALSLPSMNSMVTYRLIDVTLIMSELCQDDHTLVTPLGHAP